MRSKADDRSCCSGVTGARSNITKKRLTIESDEGFELYNLRLTVMPGADITQVHKHNYAFTL